MRALGNRPVRGTVAAAVCVVALVACGSSHKPSPTTRSVADSQGLEFANCMRAHGLTSFPDPSAGGGGFELGAGIDPQSPAFKSARLACAKFAPEAGRGVQATKSQFLAALKFAKCMRVHGVPDFPDPTSSDSPPGPILIVGRGLFFRVSPGFNPNTPAVRRAVAACGGR